MNKAIKPSQESAIRAIAFYLPQYHEVQENSLWWGEGFTDWVNVKKARARLPGHYQPHIPTELGYYDLTDASVRGKQAAMAERYGIYGFCYYHYWFNGKRLLEKPINAVLASGSPDFPFCFCWANENWTRNWDGLEKEILLAQIYSAEDDADHIRALIPQFKDPRYIKVDNKPLFLVYHTERLPDPRKTAQIWRSEARRAGIEDLYLVRVESVHSEPLDPASIGFDAAAEFAPDMKILGRSILQRKRYAPLRRIGAVPKVFVQHWWRHYRTLVEKMVNKARPPYKRFFGVCPSWDNTARREIGATVFLGSTPELYRKWLEVVVKRTLQTFKGDERLIFINAWNEWAEGCHLEPDEKFGTQYLEATSAALSNAQLEAVRNRE
ncbi:MAG TPA: glycoside hydrolase family 99-like domain-containing protein [Planktothrix sp.]|jgi:lipopolysaccharide biosynthesis protein